MRAYARDGDVYIFDPLAVMEVGPFSVDAARWMAGLSLSLRDEDLGLRLSTQLTQAADAAEAWVAALDGWHPADFVGLVHDTPDVEPIRVRIAE